jgi:hypothetical protein
MPSWLDTPPASVAAWATWLAAVAAGLVAIGWLGKEAVKGFRFMLSLARRADALLDLADHELKPNSGSSIKDAADKIPAIEQRLNDHIEASEIDRNDQRREVAGLTREVAGLTRGQGRQDHKIGELSKAINGRQDEVIHNLSEALPLVARSTPPAEEA